jgi:hypothetical protein
LGGGGHLLLDTLEKTLDCTMMEFGDGIKEIDCFLFFEDFHQPGSDYKYSFDRFKTEELKRLPTFTMHKKQRLLRVRYQSQCKLFQPLSSSEGTTGCEILRCLYDEFQGWIRYMSTRPELKKIEFDFLAFERFVASRSTALPATDGQLKR